MISSFLLQIIIAISYHHMIRIVKMALSRIIFILVVIMMVMIIIVVITIIMDNY